MTSPTTVSSPSYSRDEKWTTHTANLTAFFCLSRPSPPRPALPPEIILQILDHPTRWLPTHSASVSGRISVAHEERPILTLPPFTTDEVKSLRRLEVRFYGKDQGFSWDRQHHGTYNGSWTWFDLVLLKQHHDAADTTQARLEAHPEGHSVKRKWELQRNRHAGRELEWYEFVYDDGHQWMKELKELLREGDCFELRACAAFPAWVNQVAEAHMQVSFVDDLMKQNGEC